MSDTSVRISESTWRRLNRRKEQPGESMDEVIDRLLQKTPEAEA